MEYSTRFSLPVSAAAAWATLAALPEWPSWTPTVESLVTEGAAPEVGQRVAIKQPGRKKVTYTIDLVEPGRRFRWGSARGGVRQSADHLVVPDGDAACEVVLTFTMAGPVGTLLGGLGAARIRSMVDSEAAALRRRHGAGTGD